MIRQILHETTEKISQPPTSLDEYNTLLKRTINSIDKKIEVGGQMAASCVLGYPSWLSSHKFIIVQPWHYIYSLQQIFQFPTKGAEKRKARKSFFSLAETLKEVENILNDDNESQIEVPKVLTTEVDDFENEERILFVLYNYE